MFLKLMPCCFVLWLCQVVEGVSIYCRSRESLRETFKVVVARHPCYWIHFFCVAKHKQLCGLAQNAQKQYEDKTATHRNQSRIYLMILILDMETVYSRFVTCFIHSRQMWKQYFTTQCKLSF